MGLHVLCSLQLLTLKADKMKNTTDQGHSYIRYQWRHKLKVKIKSNVTHPHHNAFQKFLKVF